MGLNLFDMGLPVYEKKVKKSEPIIWTTNNRGYFVISSSVAIKMGLSVGDYIMFVNNVRSINEAIKNAAPEIIDFWQANDLDLFSDEAIMLTHKKFDKWGIARGIQLYDSNGDKRMKTSKLSQSDKINYAKKNYNIMYEAAMKSNNEDLKEAITRKGIRKAEIVRIFAKSVTGDYIPKMAGTRLLNTSITTKSPTGVQMMFFDYNAWRTLRAGVSKEEKRVFHVDLDNPIPIDIFDGYKNVTAYTYMLINDEVKLVDKKFRTRVMQRKKRRK